MNPLLFIVITDFNGFQQTKLCLDALRASVYQAFTVVLVDHGVTNETQQALGRNYPEVIRITGSPELWWTGATNLGIRYALDCGAELVMLLNNDCYVTPETIGELIEIWQENPRSLIAPVQRDSLNGKILSITSSSCFLLGFPTVPGPRALTQEMYDKRLLSTRLICGGRGVLLPALVFSVIGLFDEYNFPHYGADHDFYIRVAKKEWPLYVATRSTVFVDNTKTTVASDLKEMTIREWLESLKTFRSHRNIAHVSNLFQIHYPIKKCIYSEFSYIQRDIF